MALPGPLQYFPARHIFAAALVVFLVIVVAAWPTPESNITQQNYVIELPEPSEEPMPDTPQLDWEEDKVKSGDSLSVVFGRHNLSAVDVIDIAAAVSREVITLRPGQSLRWVRTADNHITHLEIDISPLAKHSITRDAEGKLQYELLQRDADFIPRFAHAVIDNSLFLDGGRAGIPDQVLYQLANIFGWDIDFALDIRKGDTISLVYEEVQLDGNKINDGDILIARFVNQGRELTAVRYKDDAGNTNYYTPEGLSMRKAFLRNPIDFARISSRFNLNRKHPVLNTIRAHKGTDYAAPTGTPIKAAGDGKVIHAGRKGGYGNVVIIQHGQRYKTIYAHLSKFGRNVRVGRYVKQGQIIGYVGMTGLATGPHLHYEFLVDGVHRDSLRVQLPKADSIASKDKPAFLERSKTLMGWLDNFQSSDKSGSF
ncbi:peptidase M23 [Thalassolituus oleivorans]|uniref:OapA family protein n=1 Tax=Thalassolituus oleivorans TaxID=187493 RepID=UPI0009492C77|nr:peptidoglycan DD-metalloendopeptidase family protein [Thalassolituus oleivorans]APR65827.1 peptidase M23 [Thalassolituus oleivorans]